MEGKWSGVMETGDGQASVEVGRGDDRVAREVQSPHQVMDVHQRVIGYGGPHNASPTDHHTGLAGQGGQARQGGLAGQGGLAVTADSPAVAQGSLQGLQQPPQQHRRGLGCGIWNIQHAPRATDLSTRLPPQTRARASRHRPEHAPPAR
ncbi:hypothetical protein CRUP_017451 [Coryphaenoides rupestris]|nr:hypothetical protein CRUP_017451 [Coryphaenoides rupestris]